ncbi:quinol:cytochrome C oxidoreductase [Arachidicoccus ginsenosidimutans]|uniref:c-type cytochrome n=1 Tax=Arachidicoccus sp. BS20 TaxID=1850526 RepID=UPI0007F09022|nr:cytochrome c [Arachidicoccus sp. BS20]ANI90221.1 quinol:cytochrome C oxidoreductase [Arachidicoccus sp. BS20]
MKRLSVIATILVAGSSVLVSCSNVRRDPGHVYMPDMFYSRAYETYAERDSAQFTTDAAKAGEKIFYNNQPVAGTIARGEDLPFPLAKDKQGDTTNYVAAKAIENPEPPLTAAEAKEIHRLYLVNCGICHGAKMDGNGPLYKDGNGPFPSKPADLLGSPTVSVMPEGQMFYSIEYGKNMMGSYASQLSRKQRWQLVHYIKAMQDQAKKIPVSPADVADSTVLAAAQ